MRETEFAAILLDYETALSSITYNEALEDVDEVNDWDIWGAAYYAVSLYTTIGYGRRLIDGLIDAVRQHRVRDGIRPHVDGRLLDRRHPARPACRGRTRRHLRSVPNRPLVHVLLRQQQTLEGAARKENNFSIFQQLGVANADVLSLPVSAMLVITMGWIFLSAAAFHHWEHRQDEDSDVTYGTALYFIFISFTTIGGFNLFVF